ncbi:major facilitator superfamily domain-containing protein [Fusarium oxysporum Fo47]|uniref:Major facilitator superfamily (MFS) profile domain-containing protein n=1 Tax=Fusarium oxysporum Fo47 TaxID=660027 RepID=W9J7U7_FUSOX|nr:major facilitator superfamily domain-containing protein [Fusarium oxysporum Fo47]EWZ27931.1 hypothetical protein FOZG_18347 [Fusarium oxysporum Fo47]QKD56729.2 major facilitator superfamily domain-containing protein [Fusarium oxysporum Fo47]
MADENQQRQVASSSENGSYKIEPEVSQPDSLHVDEDLDEKLEPTGWHTSVLVVLSSHFVVMNTSGFTNSFGALQSHFIETFDQPSSTISWIGSMQIFLYFFVGIASGRLTDAGHFRVVFLLGSLANVVCILAASCSSDLWAMFITLGLGVGLGNGSMSCPMLTVMSPYFSSRRGLAIGIAMCGACTGGLVYSAIMRQLMPTIGFPWTMRVIALIQFGTLTVSNICLRPRMKPKKTPGWIDWTAFQDARYNYYAISGFASLLSLYIFIFFIVDYSRTAVSPPFSQQNSINLLLIFNGINVFGRIGFTSASDKFGVMAVSIFVAGATATTLFSWIVVTTPPGMYVWTIFCGTLCGGIQGLFPAGLGYLTAGREKSGTRIGMAFGIVSIASLIGSPIGGVLIGGMNGKYLGAQIFAGATMALCALFVEAARRVDRSKAHDLQV